MPGSSSAVKHGKSSSIYSTQIAATARLKRDRDVRELPQPSMRMREEAGKQARRSGRSAGYVWYQSKNSPPPGAGEPVEEEEEE